MMGKEDFDEKEMMKKTKRRKKKQKQIYSSKRRRILTFENEFEVGDLIVIIN